MNELVVQLYQQMLYIKHKQRDVRNISLNEHLVTKQGLTKENVLEIKLIHVTLQDYFMQVSKQDPYDWSASDKRSIIETVEQLEFILQRAWKFEQNRNMHTWWYRVPHCTCPKLDNMDNMGTEHRYYSMTCPLHSCDNNALIKQRGDLI